MAELEQKFADEGRWKSRDTDPTGSLRTGSLRKDETCDGAHAQTGDVSMPKSDEAQGMVDDSSGSGEA